MPDKLPYKTFLATFKFAPRAAISLLIKNKNNQILLTKRLRPPFPDYWHLPGSFIIKNEAQMDCIKRVLKEELGLDLKNNKPKLVGIFDNINKDPRGHAIDIIYEIVFPNNVKLKAVGHTKEIMFFDKLPSEIGFNHKEVLNKLGYK